MKRRECLRSRQNMHVMRSEASAIVIVEPLVMMPDGDGIRVLQRINKGKAIQTTERYLGSEQDIEIAVNGDLEQIKCKSESSTSAPKISAVLERSDNLGL